jgi:hypothetical protein
MKKSLLFVFLLGMIALDSAAQTRLTHNPNTGIGNNSAVCAGPSPDYFLTAENRFFHFYDLDTYTNITDTAFFVRMLLSTQETAGGAYNIVGRVHRISGPFSVSSLFFLADDTVAIPYPDSTKYLITMPFGDGYALPGDSLASEFFLPVNPAVKFFPGSNGFPQTGLTYFVAPGCAINDFTSVATLGFPGMHMIMHLYVNQKPMMANTSFSVFKDAQLAFTAADYTAAFTDNDNDGLTMLRLESLPANGVLELSGTPLVQNDTVMTSEIDQLVYIPNAGYAGTDNYQFRAADSSHWANATATFDVTIYDWQASVAENSIHSPSVFPNPSSGLFTINAASVIERIRVFDESGRLMPTVLQAEKLLDLTGFENGIYLLEIKTGEGVFFSQIVKQ